MGDISDHYINKQLDRHMHPEKMWWREYQEEKSKFNEWIAGLNDMDLFEAAEKVKQKKTYNEKFERIATAILTTHDKHQPLSQKQRNALLGFMNTF